MSWYIRPPVDVPDNAQRREPVIVDRHGKPLIERVPRPIGFRPPPPKPERRP